MSRSKRSTLKYTKKKRGVRKISSGLRRRSRRVTRYPRYNQVHPLIKYAKLKYNTVITLDPGNAGTASSIASYSFSANGLYDPDISGTGHQPLYFDNLSALYSKYVVQYSKIRATFMNTDNKVAIYDPAPSAGLTTIPTVAYRAAIGVDLSTSDFNSYTMGNMQEEPNQRYLKWKFIPAHTQKNWTSIVLGCKPNTVASRTTMEPTMHGNSGANPSQGVYYNIYLSNATDDGNPTLIYVNVTITYWVKFYDRIMNQTQN